MKEKKKGEWIGVLGTLAVHAAIIALLFFAVFQVPQPDEEGAGLSLALGNVDAAQAANDPSLVDVDILPEEPSTPPEPNIEEVPSPDNLLTQAEEETVTLSPEEKKKQEEAERLRQEKEKNERAAEQARRKVENAFGKGAKMGNSKGSAASGSGNEGAPTGTSLTGSSTGSGRDPVFDLGGRSLRKGTSLPLPEYKVQDEGRVVVDITVNPAGNVIAASVSPRSTTVNAALRKAAMNAAKKAMFEEVDGVSNQQGTITYDFNLK